MNLFYFYGKKLWKAIYKIRDDSRQMLGDRDVTRQSSRHTKVSRNL